MRINRKDMSEKLSLSVKVSSDNLWVKTCKWEKCSCSFKTSTRNQQYCSVRCRVRAKDTTRSIGYKGRYAQLKRLGARPVEAGKASKTHDSTNALIAELYFRRQLG